MTACKLLIDRDFSSEGCMDSSCDAALQIGAHAMMGTMNVVMRDTLNGRGVVNMRLSGKFSSEIGTLGLQCAYFGLPTTLVSGDLAACHEAKDFSGEVESVETQIGIGRLQYFSKAMIFWTFGRNETAGHREFIIKN